MPPVPSGQVAPVLEPKSSEAKDGAPGQEEQSQNAARWEVEKKLQRRLGNLEKKLKEKSDELETSQGLLKQSRDALVRTQSDKDALQKRVTVLMGDRQQVSLSIAHPRWSKFWLVQRMLGLHPMKLLHSNSYALAYFHLRRKTSD